MQRGRMRRLAGGLAVLALLLPGVREAPAGDDIPAAGAQQPQRKPFQAKRKLEEDTRYWGVEWAGAPAWRLENTELQALEGKALVCRIGGGQPYASVLVYRPFPAYAAARKFTLALSFQYKAKKADATNSPVQALEFKLGKFQKPQTFEWKLQWRGAGENAPCWSYYNPSQKDPWVRTSLPGELREGVWHNLELQCRIRSGQLIYDAMVLDGKTNALAATVEPVLSGKEENRVSLGFQMTANSQADAYEMIVDQVSLGD